MTQAQPGFRCLPRPCGHAAATRSQRWSQRITWTVALLALALAAGPVTAAPEISIVALFPGKAMVRIDGRTRMLANGQTSPEGVKLVQADANQATLVIDAKTVVLGLDGAIQSTFSARPEGRSLKLAPGENGHYFVDGLVNGNAVPFMVDTGASVVAINKHVARKIGLLYRTDGREGRIETASGLVRAYYLKFATVKIRSLELRDVDGVVVDGDFPTVALLGQSFLNRFDMRREGVLLELKEK